MSPPVGGAKTVVERKGGTVVVDELRLTQKGRKEGDERANTGVRETWKITT